MTEHPLTKVWLLTLSSASENGKLVVQTGLYSINSVPIGCIIRGISGQGACFRDKPTGKRFVGSSSPMDESSHPQQQNSRLRQRSIWQNSNRHQQWSNSHLPSEQIQVLLSYTQIVFFLVLMHILKFKSNLSYCASGGTIEHQWLLPTKMSSS